MELTEGGAARVLLPSTDSFAVTKRLSERCGASGFVAKPDLFAVDLRRYLG